MLWPGTLRLPVRLGRADRLHAANLCRISSTIFRSRGSERLRDIGLDRGGFACLLTEVSFMVTLLIRVHSPSTSPEIGLERLIINLAEKIKRDAWKA